MFTYCFNAILCLTPLSTITTLVGRPYSINNMTPKTPDPLWGEVTKVHEKTNNPVNTCIHCGSKWTSNSPSRIAKHLQKCPKIPERLWERFQPSRLRKEHAREVNTHTPLQEPRQGEASSKRPKLNSFIDTCSDSEKAALDEALAEWIYGSGLPLHTVSFFTCNLVFKLTFNRSIIPSSRPLSPNSALPTNLSPAKP